MSSNYYDSIAQNYEHISFNRINYLTAVESYVTRKIEEDRPKTLLDVGSGDGKRLARILEKCTFQKITSIEPSKQMCKKIRELKLPVDLHNTTLEKFKTNEKYDLILCLWNVIGHIDDIDQFLNQLSHLLKDNGAVILDFNNKLNLKQYGLKNFLLNLLANLHIGSSSRKKGIFQLSESSYVKLWTYFEFEKIAKKYFNCRDYKSIDYNSGKIEKYYFRGQLVAHLKNI